MAVGSPDMLPRDPKRGAGVKRLNNVPKMVAFFILVIFGGVVAYTLYLKSENARLAATRTNDLAERADANGLLAGAPLGGLIEKAVLQPAKPPILTEQKVEIEKQAEKQPLSPILREKSAEELEREEARRRYMAWLAERSRRIEERQRAAIEAGTRVEIARKAAQANSGPQAPSSFSDQFLAALSVNKNQANIAENNGPRHLKISQSFGLGGFGGGSLSYEEGDVNRASEKAEFISDKRPRTRTENTLDSGREAASTRYEIKAGTLIPGVMLSALNSDLPGQIIGQVRENVFDTATGRYIVIPRGSKIIGKYDNAVTAGQQRVLVVWTRVIYPDASSLDLGNMPGADGAGVAGLEDEVDDHFFKAFTRALMLSAFSAGAQLSQGNGSTSGTLNATQVMAASLGQQMGQLGQEMFRRDLRVQPTIIIRPGMTFNVEVTKDLVLDRPWIEKQG